MGNAGFVSSTAVDSLSRRCIMLSRPLVVAMVARSLVPICTDGDSHHSQCCGKVSEHGRQHSSESGSLSLALGSAPMFRFVVCEPPP